METLDPALDPAVIGDQSVVSSVERETALAPHNACHRQCVANAQEAALWAALTGMELMAVRAKLTHGEWLPWVEGNCEYGRRTASSYLAAAERAIVAIGVDLGIAPSALGPVHYGQVRAAIVAVLENDQMAEQRAALIAAIRPPAPPKPAPIAAANAKPRAPRPSGPRPLKLEAAPQIAVRIHLAPPEVRHLVFTELRPEIEAWFATLPPTP